MATLEGRLRDPEYRNWVKSALCLQYTRDGLISFSDKTSQELHQKIIQALQLGGNPPVNNLCPNIQFDVRRNLILCCNNCNDILLEMMKYRPWYRPLNPPGKVDLNLKNSDPKQLVQHHWQCSKLFMNDGQDVNSTTPKDSDISGLINFIDHCSVPKGYVTNKGNLKQVRESRNRILHTPGMKITNNDFQNVITPLLIDLLQDPGFLLTDPDAKTAVDMIKYVKGADFIITKDDEEKALNTLKDEIHRMYKLATDEMSKLDGRFETLSKDVSALKQDHEDEFRGLQDGVKKNETDISEVKQMYETLQKQVDQSNDIHLELKKVQEEIKSMEENHNTLRDKVMDIQQELINMQRGLDETRQDIVKIAEEQIELKEKQAEDRQRQENLSKIVEGITKKDEPFIPSEQDKAGLRQYLIEGYKDKLETTLLPDWEQLHVSEIFTPSLLVANERKGEQKEEEFINLGTYREMFYHDGKLQRRVILLGEAGCGKTTFAKHLTNVWFEKATPPQFSDVDRIKQFQYVFYVSFRFAEENETIMDMITSQLFDDEKMKNVAQYVLKHFSDDCLIVLDGVDEWRAPPSYETGRRGDLTGLPGLDGVENCVFFMTSRPWRFDTMPSKTRNLFRHLKIDGIKNVEKLAEQILHKLADPDPVNSSRIFLRQVWDKNMDGLMKIPLILVIVLGGWVENKSLHKSICINYINMIQSFIRRSKGQAGWPSSESKLGKLIPNIDKLETEWGQKSNELPTILTQYKVIQRYAGLLLSVGQLAFDLLLGTGEQKQSLVFSKAKLKEYLQADDENDESIYVCLAFGIISKTETTFRGLKKLESYAFYHKTFQEFFAALWLASKYQTEKNKLYQCIKTVKDLQEFEMLIQFLCGFDPVIGKKMWLDVVEEMEMKHQWEQDEVQDLACTLMKKLEVDLKDQMSNQIYFCIPHIRIHDYMPDENIMLLYHVMEEYYSNVKSVDVSCYMKSQQQVVQNICKSIPYYSGLRKLTHADSSTVLDLQKHNKLEKLELCGISVEGLPVEGATITSLKLFSVGMTNQGMKQLEKSISTFSNLEILRVHFLSCIDNDSVCVPVLDLQKHNKLKELELEDISVEGLLLPVEGASITSLKLENITMTHHGLEQLAESLSFCTSLLNVDLWTVICSVHALGICIPVIDLRQHNKLERLDLMNISVEGLLLPVEGATFRSLRLHHVTMTHHGLEQLAESLLSCISLLKVDLSIVRCSEHAGGTFIPVIDLRQHNKLDTLWLRDMSVEGLLLPGEGATITSLNLYYVTMTHHGLEQLLDNMTPRTRPRTVLLNVRCREHGSDSSCRPLQDIKKRFKIW